MTGFHKGGYSKLPVKKGPDGVVMAPSKIEPSLDLAALISCAVMELPWAAVGDPDEHGDRYGDVQIAADSVIRAFKQGDDQ